MSRFRALWQASLNATKKAFKGNLEELMPPTERYIFNFNSKEELKKWHLYSDSEYGGLSSASLEIADAGNGLSGIFAGNLSLDVAEGTKWNISRGGFCGMRSKKFDGFIDLDAYDTIALKLKGDGRCYISTIYTENWVNSPGQEEDNSWQAFVFVPKDNWYIAKIWHPDRCCASGNLKFVEDAKKKFQNIQEAYSVLSDDNKRFLYDVGVYDNDDDELGMGGFLNEMVAMMGQTKPSEKEEGSFEELQQLFDDMFQGESNNGFGCASKNVNTTASSMSSSYTSSCESSDSNNKRNLTEMNYGKTKVEDAAGFGAHFQSFCVGTGGTASGSQEGEKNKRRHSRRSHR